MSKSIFDENTRDEIINRISKINEDEQPGWGKMNLYQMLTHCSSWDIWILGIEKPFYSHSLIGKIFGKMALKNLVKDDKPLGRNSPTTPRFKIKETKGDIKATQLKWMSTVPLYAEYNNTEFIHDFFGKMSREEVGILAYKHADHHLRQFGY